MKDGLYYKDFWVTYKFKFYLGAHPPYKFGEGLVYKVKETNVRPFIKDGLKTVK